MSANPRAPAATAQKVFICYRREETAPHAGRLYDVMVARFGEGNVFMDVELAPGVDFVERITEVVSGCLALIVVMGPSWATMKGEDGRRRIEDPDDFVRLEVETGLARSDVLAIPVLVGGARMPRREDLPPELQAITRRNAQELSEARWRYDVGRLVDTLDELLPDEGRPTAPAPERTPLRSGATNLRLALEGALIAGATSALGRLIAEGVLPFEKAIDNEEPDETRAHIASEVVRRTETLALVGLVLAIWLALRIRRVDPTGPALRGLWLGVLAGAIGGAIWTFPVYLPADKLGFMDRGLIELGASAVSGGLLGALIGSLWRPRRTGTGVAFGALGGLLFQGVVLLTEWTIPTTGERVLSAFLAVALTIGLTLAVMLALDRGEARDRGVT